MKRVFRSFIGFGVIGLWLALACWSVAHATPFSVPTVSVASPVVFAFPDVRKLLAPEQWTAIFAGISTVLTMPLTAILKNTFKIQGASTLGVNTALNGIFAGLIPYIGGYYSSDPTTPGGLSGLIFAIFASLAGVLIDHGTLKTIQQALTRALANQPGISASEIIRQ